MRLYSDNVLPDRIKMSVETEARKMVEQDY